VRLIDETVLLYVKTTKPPDGDLNKQYYYQYYYDLSYNHLSSEIHCTRGRSADIDLKGVTTWVYKLSAGINGGLAYIGNTE